MRSTIVLMCVAGLAAFVATAANVLGADAAQLLARPDLGAILVAGCAGVVSIGGAAAAAIHAGPARVAPTASPTNDESNLRLTLLTRHLRALEEEIAALRNASATMDGRLALLERLPNAAHHTSDRQVARLHQSGMSVGEIASRLELDGAETRLQMQLLDANVTPAEVRS